MTIIGNTVDKVAPQLLNQQQMSSVEQSVNKWKSILIKRKYIFHEAAEKALRGLVKGRSVVLTGSPGTGKSLFFKLLGIPMFSLVYAQTKRFDEISAAFDHYRNANITVDDIGAEGKFNNYGTQAELLDFVLSRREDASRPTYYTTNLTPEQIQERYGERIIDRLSAAIWIDFGKESLRSPDRPSRGHNEYYSFYCYTC